MSCTEIEPLIGASLDGELDPVGALRVEDHLATCNQCSQFLVRLELLREEIASADLDWSAHTDLRRIRAAIRRREPALHAGASWWRRPFLGSAAAAFAAGIALMIFWPGKPGIPVERQIVDSHVRSMLADHLIDVQSSDRHTVKPWFQGKLKFAPNVPDLSNQGFVLSGGRLDVLDGKEAAALVYRRRNHVINLWTMPGRGGDRGIESSALNGFQLLHWQRSGMLYWAASDLNVAELREFAELMLKQ